MDYGANFTADLLRPEPGGRRPAAINLDLFLDSDPVVSGEVAVQNIGLVTNQFTLVFTLPTGPIGPSTLTGGSVAGGVTDNDGTGATLSTPVGSAFYSALIDSVTHQMLFPHSVVLNAPAFDSADLVPPGAFGNPDPEPAGPGSPHHDRHPVRLQPDGAGRGLLHRRVRGSADSGAVDRPAAGARARARERCEGRAPSIDRSASSRTRRGNSAPGRRP